MKQAVMQRPGAIEIREVDAPTARRGEVLLRIRRIGVCGSDVHVHHGRHAFTNYPVVQGHEFSAVIEAVGEGVAGFAPGQKVTAMPQITCGKCRPCRAGRYHICENLRVMGFQSPGVAQEWFALPAEKVLALPEDFTHEQGALVEPTAVACHAVRRAGAVRDENVVVLGGGPIGNLVGQVLSAEGARVLLSDVSDARLGVARECGLAVFDPRESSLAEAAAARFSTDGFYFAFECAGVVQTIAPCLQAIGKGGVIVQVALYGEDPAVPMSLVPEHELSILGSMMYQREDYQRAIELLSGSILWEPLLSRHVPFQDYPRAYEIIETESDAVMKIMIDMP